MDIPDNFANWQEWTFHSFRFFAFLEIVLEHAPYVDYGREDFDIEGEYPVTDSLALLRFHSPFSFGWVTDCFMNQYYHAPHPVIQQIDNGDLPACVPGFRVFEDFVEEGWLRYDVAAGGEIMQVLTLEPPQIEIFDASPATKAHVYLPSLSRMPPK